MSAYLQALPEPVRAVVLACLDDEDVRALHIAGVVDWRARSAWQQRLPVELVQQILGLLPLESFYITANCVCAHWRRASRSASLLRYAVRVARDASASFRRAIAGVVLSRTYDVDALFTYLLVAAPLRNRRRPERPHRVSTLNFRPLASAPLAPPRVFASDYAGVLAVAAGTGICLYCIDRLRSAKGPSAADTNSYIASLAYPARLSHDQLLDISIAHQTSESRHLVLFAIFEDPKGRRDGLLYRCDIYYVVGHGSDHRQQIAFSQVKHTPLMPVWDPRWGKDSVPDWLWGLCHKRKCRSRDVRVRAIEPPHPCATAVALRTKDTTCILLFDVLIGTSGGRSLSPYKRYKERVPPVMPSLAEGAIRKCTVNPTRLLFAMSPGKHRRPPRHTHSSDRSYPPLSEDKDAVVDRESFLEWFSELCWPPYSSVLKSLEGNTHYGVEFSEGRLLMCRSKLAHNGLTFNTTRVELALPAGASARPSCVAALSIADEDDSDAGRGVILVAACWDDPCELHMYEVLISQLASRQAVLVPARRLARFRPTAKRRMVATMRFYGGVSRTWRGMPCERTALLVVIMHAGFVHICQVSTNHYPDWALNAAAKLRLGVNGAHHGAWRTSWTVQADGKLAP